MFAILAVVVPLLLRWWDRRARLEINFYIGDDPPREWVIGSGIIREMPPDMVAMFWVSEAETRRGK